MLSLEFFTIDMTNLDNKLCFFNRLLKLECVKGRFRLKFMNMILTSTTGGLGAKAIEPFFNSLRLSGCQDPVVVFASKISDECRELLAKYQATVIDFDYRGMPVVSSLGKRLLWARKMVFSYYRNHRLVEKDFRYLYINCSRFFGYHQYLSHLQLKPEFVLLADIRDIVFQKNPFSFPFQTGLSVTTEHKVIAQSKGAIKQLCQSVGPLETCRLAPKRIINGGTILADFETTMKFLELQTAHLNRAFFWGLFEGLDQALTAYFVYNKMLAPVHVHNNWQGPFLTLDSVAVTPKHKNSSGYLCNEDGSIIPIVHQYDRIKGLYKKDGAVPPCWEFYAN